MDQELLALDNAVDLLDAGEIDEAQIVLIGVLKANPKLAQAWYLLSFSMQGREQKIYTLRRALHIQPNLIEARTRLNALEDHTSHLDSAPKKTGLFVDQKLSIAQAFLDAGDLAAADSLLREFLSTNPEQGQAWYLLSFATQNDREKICVLRQALRVDPGFEEAQVRLNELQTPNVDDGQSLEPADQIEQPIIVAAPESKKSPSGTFTRIAKYTAVKGITLFFTVVVGVYITILIANMGGYVDEIVKGQIAQSIMGMAMAGAFDDIPEDEKDATIEQLEWQMQEARGLHEPFVTRTFVYLVDGLTLNFGEAYLTFFSKGFFRTGTSEVRTMVLERLPYTILLVGVSNFLFFFVSIFVALFLSRRYGGILDRISVILASLMSAPSWIFGILLVVVLAGELQILDFPKTIDMQYAGMSPDFLRLLLSQMIMPVMAIFLSVIFTGIFTWRTFFLIYSGEDYVEMARAQGLSNRVIERRYILRPSLPYVITSFSMMMISLWEGSIALEVLFNWPGVGNMFYQATKHINNTSISLIVAIVVIFAYLLALTVFLLDIIYALIDPRVQVKRDQKLTASNQKQKKNFFFWQRKKTKKSQKSKKGPTRQLRPVLHIPQVSFSNIIKNFLKPTGWLRSTLREVVKFPSAILGLAIILILIGVSIYTMFAVPYEQAVLLWQTHNPDELGRTTWYQNPHNARPTYVNFFRSEKLPETIIRDSRDEGIVKSREPSGESAIDITYSLIFEYPYGDFPVEMVIFFDSVFEEKLPHISMDWLTPDGREIRLGSISPEHSHRHSIDQDDRLQRKMGEVPVIAGLLGDPAQDYAVPLQGTYELQISSLVFEPEADVDAEMLLYGQVSGMAGTDDQRRDLMVALLWGTPVALAFGFMGAIVTSLISMFIAAVGVWYGGWVDGAVQRITEVNIILPTLPVAIMVFVMYSKSIWSILWVIVLLNIFGSSIKNYRSVFLQVKDAGYIEGAQAYGASNRRIIVRYLIPRIIPVLIPQLVIMVPGFVFYEATLAYLGLSDPQLPTWGKVIHDAVTNGLYQGHYYWVLQPVILLVLTGLAFALFGFALDRVINPRLREI